MADDLFDPAEIDAMKRVDPMRTSQSAQEVHGKIYLDTAGKKWGVAIQDGRYVKYPR
jgi:hypothetical protein